MTHHFIFKPGEWLGYGMITLQPANLQMRFYTHWTFLPIEEGVIHCEQLIEKEPDDEITINVLSFSHITESTFQVVLISKDVGEKAGIGSYDGNGIRWEFVNQDTVGKEEYLLQSNGDYLFHAQYSSYGDFHISIEGRLWPKSDVQR